MEIIFRVLNIDCRVDWGTSKPTFRNCNCSTERDGACLINGAEKKRLGYCEIVSFWYSAEKRYWDSRLRQKKVYSIECWCNYVALGLLYHSYEYGPVRSVIIVYLQSIHRAWYDVVVRMSLQRNRNDSSPNPITIITTTPWLETQSTILLGKVSFECSVRSGTRSNQGNSERIKLSYFFSHTDENMTRLSMKNTNDQHVYFVTIISLAVRAIPFWDQVDPI